MVKNTRLNHCIEIEESKLSDLFNNNPNWNYDDEIVIIRYGYKFICRSESQFDVLMSITDPSVINKCKCGTLVYYGYVLAFKEKNNYKLDGENFVHCDNCHNIWDGNAQCNCYGFH